MLKWMRMFCQYQIYARWRFCIFKVSWLIYLKRLKLLQKIFIDGSSNLAFKLAMKSRWSNLDLYISLLLLKAVVWYSLYTFLELSVPKCISSNLTGVIKPPNKNWEIGKLLSRFVWQIMGMSSSLTCWAKSSKLLLMELILRWATIILFRAFLRRARKSRFVSPLVSIFNSDLVSLPVYEETSAFT